MRSHSSRYTHSTYWNVLLVLMAMGASIALFLYGIHVPFHLRVRGDAAEYLSIASQFGSLSDALHYIGARTPGFPLFDYLFIHQGASEPLEIGVNRICWALFFIHEGTVVFLCWICSKLNLFPQHSIYYGLLFLLLAVYPAFVMHTTSPLTDTFGMDLLLIVFSLFAWSECGAFKNNVTFIILGVVSGVLLGYAVLVRPAYWVAATGFLLVYAVMACMNRKLCKEFNVYSRFIVVTSATMVFCALIWPVLFSCKAHYGSLCLENPGTFPLLRHVKDGLVGARVLWNLYPTPLSIIPVVPDPFMVKFFYFRCPLVSIIGTNEQSLLGCLAQHPFHTVIFLLKKLIGFFDAFRITPYTELVTPAWYVWVSRAFSSLAFVGFVIALSQGVRSGWRLLVHRQPASTPFTAAWFFCIILLATHTLLHVEERFILPCIPLCFIGLLLKAQELSGKGVSTHPCHRWIWCLFSMMLIILFFTQVLDWDSRVITTQGRFQIRAS